MKLMYQLKNLGLTLAFAGAVLAAPLAQAGTEPYASKDKTVEMTPVEEFSWTGLYIGGSLGANWTDYDFDGFETEVDLGAQANEIEGGGFDEGVDILFFETPGYHDQSDDSFFGGGQLGYQYQFGHFVFGIEADFMGTSSSAQQLFQSETIFSGTDGLDTDTNVQTWRKIDNSWQASARARFGYTRGRVLLYITGGGVWQDAVVRANDIASTNFFEGDGGAFVANVTSKNKRGDEDIICGWTAGLGAEWAFTDIASLGFEYRHNGFGDNTYHFPGNSGGPVFQDSFRVDQDSDQVTFKINFLLGRVGN